MSKVNTGQASSTLIPKYIGSDFDKVVAVADNIEQVVTVGDNIEDVGTVADNINYVKEVAEDLHGMPVTMYTGENPPVLNPMPEGVMWYCTTDGRTYVWYTDADSGQWVESAPQSAMKDEATNIFFHSTPSNVNPAYRSATLYSSPAPEAEISVAHNALNTPVVQAQFIREEALWADVSVIGAQGIVTLMGYSSGNSQLKAEIITWKDGAEGTSLGTSKWVTLPNQPSVVSLPVTFANIDVLDAGDSYVVKLTSQMNAGGSAISTILVNGNTNSRFGIIFNTNLIGLNDGIRDGVITSAPTENAVYDALQLKVGKSQLVQSGNLTSTANWANVPAYSDSELGGSGGPLNAQAKALTARSELLLTDVKEALRRSYAEAGYNLVDGSFEVGGVLVSTNDVLLQERTGKAFSGPAGPVAAGTTPVSGGFVDRSNSITVRCRDVADLKQINPFIGPQRAYLSSVNTGVDGGAGYMVFDPASTDSEYQGVVVKPPMLSIGRWKRESKEDLSLYHFGAYGDGSRDDTQSALDWLRWQLDSGKTKSELGAGNFLITSQLPFFNRGTVFGSGYDTNLVIGLNDDDILFSVPNGAYGYSWAMKDVRFTVASGGSTRCRLFDVNGSLRGARIQDISAWEFSRPLRFANNIWGNLILDGVNLYRISNPIVQGDIAIEYAGNTMMSQNIEIIGAFDRLIKFKGSVFKLDGLNPSGSSGASVAGSGILIEDASSGYIRSGWIELVDKNISNGEAEAVMVRNSKNITVENMHIPTGSVWFDGGSRNAVRNIAYFQTNAGVRAINNAQVDVSLSGLGKYNLSTSDAKRTYAKPSLVDGNNTGKGLLPNPIDPIAMTVNVTKTNSSFVSLTADSIDFNSGTQSTKVTTTSAYHGVNISASVVPGKIYTVCAAVKVSSGIVVMSQGENTSGKTDSVIYVGRSMGASGSEWLLLSFPASSSTTTLTVRIRNEVAGEFLLDAVDIYAGASTFNPSNLG